MDTKPNIHHRATVLVGKGTDRRGLVLAGRSGENGIFVVRIGTITDAFVGTLSTVETMDVTTLNNIAIRDLVLVVWF